MGSAKVQLVLLGGFAARDDAGRAIPIGSRKAQALLAFLSLSPGKPQSREKLTDLLWSDRGEAQARSSLRQALSELRRVLPQNDPPLLVTERHNVWLNPDAVQVDAVVLDGLAASADPADLARAAQLYQGDFLDGLDVRNTAFEDWRCGERRRLRDRITQVLAASLERQGADQAMATAQRLLALDPLHEGAHRKLMRLYADKGERMLGLKQYQACRDALAAELGVDPEAETERLAEEIRGHVRDAAQDRDARPAPETSPKGTAPPVPALPLPDKPSIAVLPFTNIGDDPEQEYFADGLVEEIITGLSRVRSFFVIARNSSFTYKGRAVDVRQVARELGVRYVLEGSIRKAGLRVRIVGQLVDAISGHHVWADRFEGDITDIFDLQDKITESVVGAVEPSIRLQEIRQSRHKPTNYITAYDLYLRALPRFYSMTREGFSDVRRLTNEALSIDPEFTVAKALGAYIRSLSVSQCWHEPDDIRVAIRMAREVIAEAADDPTCLRFAAQVLAYSAKDYDQALDAIGRSLYLNPSSAQGYTGSGWVNAHAGRPLVAIDHFQKAMRLSPIDPEKGIALSGVGMSYLMLEQFEEALAWGENALREMSNYGSSHRVVIGALVGLNRTDEARAAARRLLEAFPTYTLALQKQINPWRDLAFAERYVEALRIAGIPD